MLKHMENSIEADPKLQKAPVNYEGVSLARVLLIKKKKCLTQINILLFKAKYSRNICSSLSLSCGINAPLLSSQSVSFYFHKRRGRVSSFSLFMMFLVFGS